ncbi:YhgE/Pip domain-containing protein [Bifidobacterium stellenboschense]|uniref:ABC transporter n=1 Tax=Bifidobacterium stellenboschense TaxID=762211 RepID=A0A087DIC1_9BIFI|nr:YhgE/Pip domain-containing protein [Bifidobacterium stellenboschense]KFI95271.1 ABC transporter [Bifidobacterium stellenboschense]
MGNVLAIIKRDLIRMLKVPAAWVIAAGLTFIPPLYAWFNIVGFWNPYGNTQGIQVVIANNDKGTNSALIGKQNLGDQIVTQLKANHQLGWTFTDQSEAMNRVESGKAYAAIIIPKDFSDRMAGVVTGGDRPQLEYYVNEKANAVAPKITDVGAGTVDTQVNGTFVSTVSKVLSEAVNKASDKAGTTAGTLQTKTLKSLDDARRDVVDTRGKIDDLTATLKQTPAKTQQARKALTDVQRLANDATTGLNSTSQLIGTTQTTLNTFVTTTSGTLDTGTSLLSQASQQATDGVNQIAGGITVANGAVGDAVTTLTQVNQTNKQIIDQLKTIVTNPPDGIDTTALKKVVDELEQRNAATAETLKNAKTLNDDTTKTVTSVSGLATTFNTATQSTLTTTTNARKTLTTGALPQLNSGLNTLAGTTGTLAGGLTSQGALISQTNVVLDQLDRAAADTVTALGDTDKALAGMETKLDTVATDLRALDTSSMLGDLFGSDGKLDTKRIAEFMLSPTMINKKILYPVASYGSGMAPLFTNMALWVGAFALAVILKLETDDEGIENMTITQGYLGRFLLFCVFAAAQGLATTVGDLIIGVQSVNPFAFVLTGVITSLVYASLIFALSTTFLHVGKGVCVALIILQIPGASGLYPIEMMPAFFRNLYPMFPFTYSIDAFRETIGGFYDGQWFAAIGHLLLFALVGLAIGLFVRPLMANMNRLFAREIEESDMIIGEPVHMPGTEYRLSTAVRMLSSHEGYRERIERQAARFAVHYPRLKQGALVAGIVVPVILAVTFSLTPNTKLEALLAWIIWILIIIAFLLTIEFMNDNLRRQMELGNLDDEAIRTYIRERERIREKAKARKRERVREKLAQPLNPTHEGRHAQ